MHASVHIREAPGHGQADGRSAPDDRATTHADPRPHKTAVVESDGPLERDHPHSSFEAAVTPKSVTPLLAVVALRVTMLEASERRIASARPRLAVRARVSPSGDAPPRLRAPPAFTG
ncbi:MAG: hypothetical protein ABIV11_10035 [Gemmatimonadaceae bacterium]